MDSTSIIPQNIVPKQKFHFQVNTYIQDSFLLIVNST